MMTVSIEKVWSIIKQSFKIVFGSVGTAIKFCLGFVLASISLYIGIIISNIKAIIPDFFGIADEINGEVGILHLIVRIMGWCTIVVPVAIASAIAFLLLNIVSKESAQIRNAARVVYTTLIMLFFLPRIFGGETLDGLDTLDMLVMMGTIVAVCLAFIIAEQKNFFFGENENKSTNDIKY
jgi:flagellar biosynthesis protein FlhB